MSIGHQHMTVPKKLHVRCNLDFVTCMVKLKYSTCSCIALVHFPIILMINRFNFLASQWLSCVLHIDLQSLDNHHDDLLFRVTCCTLNILSHAAWGVRPTLM